MMNVGLVSAAASDALAFFASSDAIDNAIRALRANEFPAWDTAVSNAAADELEAMRTCYHILPEAGATHFGF
jgi:hypothetical protein